jgi:hypothetical protein
LWELNGPDKEKRMTKLIVFVQVHGRAGVIEAELSASPTLAELSDALAAAGVGLDADSLIFINEAEDPVTCGRHDPVPGLRHGCRVHVGRCKRVKVTVNYLEKTAGRDFPPGVRIRAVKEWAVHTFALNPKDAAEHVLQLCQSTDRPPSDTPVLGLVGACGCAVCLDLVPDKRVEG